MSEHRGSYTGRATGETPTDRNARSAAGVVGAVRLMGSDHMEPSDMKMGDAHDAMLRLATDLAAKEAAGQCLSAHEQIIADITWIDIQAAPNGLEGWLYYTSNDRIQRTLAALDRIGCAHVAGLVKKSLVVAAVDPLKMSDRDREARLDSLSE